MPLLEIRVAADEALLHRDAVDLLLVPVGKLALHFTAVVVERFEHRRNVLPIQDLKARHYGLRFCTNSNPKRPLMHRLPRVTSWSSGEVTFTMSGAVEYNADFQMSGSTMYIYFRPRQVTASNFATHVIELPVTSVLNSLSNLGDTFGESGSPDALIEKFGLTSANIIKAAHASLAAKKG